MGTNFDRTRNLRYKRPALASLGYEFISNELYDLRGECDNVRYYIEEDEDSLLKAFDGEEEEAYEFKMVFGDLSAKADSLDEAIRDSGVEDYFDDCIVGMIGNRYSLVGYDAEEEDYYGLTRYEAELATTLSGKRLMQKTKPEMISIIGQCLGIVIAFLDIRHSYDYLKATFDILHDQNVGLLQAIKEIEGAYELANAEGFDPYSAIVRQYDRQVKEIPDRIWIE